MSTFNCQKTHHKTHDITRDVINKIYVKVKTEILKVLRKKDPKIESTVQRGH